MVSLIFFNVIFRYVLTPVPVAPEQELTSPCFHFVFRRGTLKERPVLGILL